MTQRAPRTYGVAFWLVCAVWATAALFFGGIVTLAVIFSVTSIRSDGFSWSGLGTCFGAAVIWSIIGLIGTCYFSIPIATVLTGCIRIASRQLSRWRAARPPQEDSSTP